MIHVVSATETAHSAKWNAFKRGTQIFQFEFTEWGHTIENLKKPKAVLENWLTAKFFSRT